jgi:hypothetical protein
MYCMTSGTIPTATGIICDGTNSGDVTADLVLGKGDLNTAGCDCTPETIAGDSTKHCLSAPPVTPGPSYTSASSLCLPTDVEVDQVSVFDTRVYVADSGNGYNGLDNGAGRILRFQPGANWLAAGTAANVVLGSRPDVGLTFSSYGRWGRGTCESSSTGASQNLECNYEENESGGPPGAGAKKCVTGNWNDSATACTVNGACPSGTCGCPDGGYCRYRRQLGSPMSIAFNRTRQVLYVARQGGLQQFVGPFTSNMPSTQVGMKGKPHYWNQGSGFGSFAENTFAGYPTYSAIATDSGGNLYAPVGPFYGGGLFGFLDPAPPLPTSTPTSVFTATRTYTPVNTPTSTPIPTSTSTPAATFTGTLVATATATAVDTPTLTPTATTVWTATSTPLATGTPTAGGPTSTQTLPPATSTPTPVMAHVQPLNADGFYIPPGSSCTKESAKYGNTGKQIVRCPGDFLASFYVRFHVPASATRILQLTSYSNSELSNGDESCWYISNTVNVPNGLPVESVTFGSGIFLRIAHESDILSNISNSEAKGGPTAIELWNGKTGAGCVDDSVCDESVGYLFFARVGTPGCNMTTPEDFDQFTLSWP